MTVNTYKEERDISQQAMTLLGEIMLRAYMNEIRERFKKLAWEPTYYMGLYHQVVPVENKRGVFFLDMNNLLRHDHIRF